MNIESTPSKVRLRDRRKPGHFWADNELFDVFSPIIGAHGVITYIALARLCFGASAQCSLRELAEMTGLGKSSVERAVAKLKEAGLVLVHSRANKTAWIYELTDLKELAAATRSTVPRGDSYDAPAVPLGDSFGTELSHGGTELSQGQAPTNRQYTILQDIPPARATSTSDELAHEASVVMERCSILPGEKMREQIAATIGLLAKDERTTVADAALRLIERMLRARWRGEVLNNFWITDEKWRIAMPKRAGPDDGCSNRPNRAPAVDPTLLSEREADAIAQRYLGEERFRGRSLVHLSELWMLNDSERGSMENLAIVLAAMERVNDGASAA